MIIDLPRFIASERPTWTALEEMLDRLEGEPTWVMSLEEVQRFHLLYQKVCAALGRVATFASEPELKQYLESLTARAYGEIHETRERGRKFRPAHWFLTEFPRAFRRRFGVFVIVTLITLASMVFGGLATTFDQDAKDAIVPAQFAYLLQDPAKYVAAQEEMSRHPRDGLGHSHFATFLMQNNIQVSIRTLGLGITFGVGTVLSLIANFVHLGTLLVDFVRAGQTMFLLGWLMPHGVIEIPSILIAAQGGLLLGKTLIGRGDRASLPERLRSIGPDLMALTCGCSVMLVWAGIVEAFLSQYHEPVIHYWQKIAFGVVELVVLVWFLGFRKIPDEKETA